MSSRHCRSSNHGGGIPVVQTFPTQSESCLKEDSSQVGKTHVIGFAYMVVLLTCVPHQMGLHNKEKSPKLLVALISRSKS